MTWTFQPVWPLGAIAGAALLLLLGVAWSSRVLLSRNVAKSWVARLALLRILATGVLLLFLLRPSLRMEREVPVREDRIILIDTSASMGQTDSVKGHTRLEDVVQTLRKLREIRESPVAGKTHWYAFDEQVRPLDPENLDALKPEGVDTRLGVALEQAWNLSFLENREGRAPGTAPPRFLLAGDGADRGRLDALEVATRLGVAVDVLPPRTVPQPTEARLEIANVQYSRRLLPGSELRIQVIVRRQGIADDTPGNLVLSSDDRRLQTRRLRFAPGTSEQRLILTHRPETPGLRRYRLTLESNNELLKESLRNAAPVEATVRVESRRHEVLVIEPRWRWSFRFLRRVLESDPNFVFTGFLSRGPGVFIQFGEPERRTSLGGFPRSRAELQGFDTLILGDAHPSDLPGQLPRALHQLVTEDGKSLVVIAGPNLRAWRNHPLLSELLPVELYPDGRGLVSGPLSVSLSLDGRDSPFFYTPEGGSSERSWSNLPPLAQIYAPERKKPAATILLEAPTRRNEFGPLIVAALHPVGRGQVLYIGTDSLWRWHMQGVADSNGNTPYQAFWQQAMRALRPDRLLASPLQLWILPERTRVQEGQSVAVHARIEGAPDNGNARVEGKIRLPDEKVLPILFTRDPDDPERFRAEFEASAPGDFEIRAEALLEGQSVAENAATIDVFPRPPETAPTPVNLARLDNLATRTGGIRLDPDAPVPPPSAVPGQPTRKQTVTVDLWNTVWLLLALTLILGADWVIRLMRGYV